jgi:CHAD domain-containing protein
LTKRARRLRAAVDEARQMYAPERLHAVRIAAKKLRYGVELAADSSIPQAMALLRPIKRAQDLLGRLHDLNVLQTHVAAVQAGPGADRPGMHSALDLLARHIEEQCRHLHGRYVMSAASLAETCSVIESRLVPAVRKVPRRAPLKMALRRKRTAAAAGSR